MIFSERLALAQDVDEDRYDAAETLQEEALARFRVIGHLGWVGYVLNALGVIAYERGQMARAAA